MKCNVCEKINASFRCESCGMYYCEECADLYIECDCIPMPRIISIEEYNKLEKSIKV